MNPMTEPIVSKAGKLERRKFLKVTGGFLLAVTLEGGNARALAAGETASSVAAFIRIGADESITILAIFRRRHPLHAIERHPELTAGHSAGNDNTTTRLTQTWQFELRRRSGREPLKKVGD